MINTVSTFCETTGIAPETLKTLIPLGLIDAISRVTDIRAFVKCHAKDAGISNGQRHLLYKHADGMPDIAHAYHYDASSIIAAVNEAVGSDEGDDDGEAMNVNNLTDMEESLPDYVVQTLEPLNNKLLELTRKKREIQDEMNQLEQAKRLVVATLT